MDRTGITRKAPLMVVLLMLLTSLAPLSLGDVETPERPEPTIFVEGLPPLLCEDGLACPTPDRGVGSWLAYSPDRDHNGMDDRLQRVLAGEYESVSTTAILGPDGRKTVAIIVDFEERPDPDGLKAVLSAHGWNETGAWFDVLSSIPSIAVDHVPLEALLPVWRMAGVVTVEQQNVMAPSLDQSVPSMKVRDGEVYEDTAHTLGHRGDGVVVAVLDTGVDNEHRSLNDFDDIDDDPDIDANSYVDPKWVAGYDATSAFSNTSGTDDPDDSAGHGTHVASTSVGTGSSDRVYVGVAPGAYLIDVKVLTDAGGTNAQNTLRGLQWAINNVDTDWGNNQSSNGIDILSMSYSSVNNPNSDDPGDNGSSAESQMVNQATGAGLICVIAMGNDGMRRVPSPASADTSIAIGAIDEHDTHDRADDSMASYSNWGPRESDGDGDDHDELKPDVVAPGSGIHAAMNAAGSIQLPNQPRPTADNDYTTQSGTSMATPHVSGLIAILLGIDPALDIDDIRDMLHESSEVRGSPYDDDIDPVWNEKFGFGIVDSSRLVENLTGETGGGGGGNNSTEPPPSGSGDWVDIDSPVAGEWMIEGESYRVRGTAASDTIGADIEEVLVRGWYWYQEPGTPKEKRDAFDWTQAVGRDNWSHTFLAQDWVDGDEITIEAKARDSTNAWSDTADLELMLGSQSIAIGAPSGQDPVQGVTRISGTFLTPEPISVQWRIDRGDWQEISVSSSEAYTSVDWSVDWDTTALEDGFHRIAVQGRDQSRVVTDELRRTVEVDNHPPAPDLSIFGSISVEEYGIPIDSAYVNTFLEVRADIRNNGDAEAENVIVHLREGETKRSEATIALIEPGQVIEVVLYWNPMAAGTQDLEVVIDPGLAIDEPDRSDNSATIQFPVTPRPDGVDLAIRDGAVTTNPPVPRPGEPYTISVRIDNLGAHDSEMASIQLMKRNDFGLFEEIGTVQAATVLGQTSTSIAFQGNVSLETGVAYRVSVTTATDLDLDNNLVEFVVVQDAVTLSGARTPALQSTHTIEASAGLGADSLMFSSKGGALFVHRMAADQSLYTCLELESDWVGDLAVHSHQGIVTVAWTRSYLDADAFMRSTVSYSTIDRTCQMTPRQDLMPGLLTAEGTYWGIGMDQSHGEVVIAGYHRDLFTSGSYQDTTSIFLVETESLYSADDWSIARNVVLDIDLHPRSAPAIEVEIGDEDIHLLHQNMRDDSTGEERLGLFYAHGRTDEQNWAFSIAAGDHATAGRMVLVGAGDDEQLITAWREGEDAESVLVTRISSPSWLDGVELRTPARGLSAIELLETERGVQILYDAVSPTGPKLHYGLLSNGEGGEGMWLSDTIGSGVLLSAWRTEESGELHFAYATSNGLRVRKMVEDPDPVDRDDGWLEDLRISLGLDERTFEALLKTVGITCTSLTLFVAAVMVMNRGRRRGEGEATFVNENWVDLDDETPFAHGDEVEVEATVVLDEEEDAPVVVIDEPRVQLEDDEETPTETAEEEAEHNVGREQRTARRERRAVEAEMKQLVEEMQKAIEEGGLPPLPAPGEMPAPGALPPLPGPNDLPPPGMLPPLPSPADLPPPGEPPPLPAPGELPPLPDLPAPEIPVTCTACDSAFTARANAARRVKCPLCGETVRL